MTLFLLGMIESANPTKSLALFTASEDEITLHDQATTETGMILTSSETYAPSSAVHVGDAVKGYRVKEIAHRQVLLEKGGKAYWVRAGEGLDENSPMAVKITTGFEVKNNEVHVSEELHDFVVKDGLVPVLMSACTEPVTENGQTIGFRLFEIDPGSAFEIAGFKNGDIVTELDGIQLVSPFVALRALAIVKDKKEFSFSFRRAGAVERRSVFIR